MTPPRIRHYAIGHLSDDHPISFAYTAGLTARKRGLSDPALLPRELRLDNDKQLQCTTCHNPHSDNYGKFLTRSNAQSQMCQACHDGCVAAKNILTDLYQSSTHPVFRTTGVHDPAEDPRTMRKHVECADCHNAHRASGGSATRAPRRGAGQTNAVPGSGDPRSGPVRPRTDCRGAAVR